MYIVALVSDQTPLLVHVAIKFRIPILSLCHPVVCHPVMCHPVMCHCQDTDNNSNFQQTGDMFLYIEMFTTVKV